MEAQASNTPTVVWALTPEEAGGIIQVLGQLPTSSGAWPLQQKLVTMTNKQIKTTVGEPSANNEQEAA